MEASFFEIYASVYLPCPFPAKSYVFMPQLSLYHSYSDAFFILSR